MGSQPLMIELTDDSVLPVQVQSDNVKNEYVGTVSEKSEADDIFADGNDLPSLGVPDATNFGEVTKELLSQDITKVISSEIVKTTNLEKVSSFKYPAYMIDMSDIGPIVPIVLRGMLALIHDVEGESSATVYLKYNEEVTEIGHGSRELIHKNLRNYLEVVFPNENRQAKMYASFSGEKFRKLKSIDIKGIQLNI